MTDGKKSTLSRDDSVKKFFFAIIMGSFILILFSVLIGVYRYQFKKWVHNQNGFDIVEKPAYRELRFPKLTERQSFLIGWTKGAIRTTSDKRSATRTSSYHDLSEKKAPGVVRVGLFGCSFVEGSEAGVGLDFPTLLQKKLVNSGYGNIEIINFGVGSYGMHQSHLLWEYIGKNYDLDYIVFLPITVYVERDATFKFDNLYYPLHARYILDGDTIRLLVPEGDSRLDAVRIYHRILQPWRYVRNDFRMPNFVKMFTPVKWRERRNPFYYYSGKPRDEVLKTYAHIFDAVARSGKPVIVISVSPDVRSLAKSIKAKNVFFYHDYYYDLIDPMSADSIYYAPGGHFSATGNQARADIIYAIMTGNAGMVPMLSLAPTREAAGAGPRPRIDNDLKLFEYDSVAIEIGSARLSTFVTRDEDAGGQFVPIGFKNEKTASIILTPHLNPEIVYIYSPNVLGPERQVLSISYKSGGERLTAPIGHIERLSPAVGVMRLGGGDAIPVSGVEIARFSNHELRIRIPASVGDPRLLIGDSLLAVGRVDDVKSPSSGAVTEVAFRFYPSRKNRIGTMRSHGDEYFDVHAANRRGGSLDLVLRHRGNSSVIPIGTWRVIEKEVPRHPGFIRIGKG